MFCRNCGKELTGTPELCMNCGARPTAGNSFCNACGAATDPLAEICLKCGARLTRATQEATVSPKSRLAATLLAFFLGQFGAHRFYLGNISTAVTLLVLTIIGYSTIFIGFGVFILIGIGIWVFVDFIMAVAGTMKDKAGNPVKKW